MSTFGGEVLPDETLVDSFTDFVKEAEPRLRQVLCAAFGRDVGIEATADALAYGWEHWERIQGMENPIGYLWGVGKSRARPRPRRRPTFLPVPTQTLPWVEPGLPEAFGRLSERQRVVVFLIHGYDWAFTEVAEFLGVGVSTVQKHEERGMAKLRRVMGATR